jgi:hypothetical protein
MNKTIINTTIAMALFAGSASAFFGDSNTDGYLNTDTSGAFDTNGRGKGYGRADVDGTFSMTINAEGSGSSKMNTDIDGDSASRFNGINDTRFASTPQYYGFAPYGTAK